NKMCSPARCVCKEGFYRKDGNANLQQPTKKPDQSDCQPNELFRECSSMCEPKCGANNRPCTAKCGPPKCQCQQGYYLDTSGDCVSRDECEWV
ncbi:hypothetical protein PMAYCL1PPCAC_26326, partial [Pristionchus mayeri]